MKRFFLIGLVLLLFGSCREEDSILPADPQGLLGNWVLISPQTGYTITLQIKPNPNIYTYNIPPYPSFMVSGKGPVNQYSSVLSYAPDGTKPDDRQIRIEPGFTSTMIAETAEQAAAAGNYLGSLVTVRRYELTQRGQLRFYYNPPYRTTAPTVLIYQRQ